MKKIIMIFAGLFLFICLIYAGISSRKASIGIIGGADGPTTIYITSTTGERIIPWTIIIALLIIALFFILLFTKVLH